MKIFVAIGRLKGVAQLALILTLSLLVTQCALFRPDQRNRSYTLTNKTHGDDKALDFNNSRKIEINRVMLSAPEKISEQAWQIVPDEDGELFRITNRSLGEEMSLEVFDDQSDNRLRIADSAEDDGQLWRIVPVRGNYYRITNKWLGDDKSLKSISGAIAAQAESPTDTYLEMAPTSNDDPDQLWIISRLKSGSRSNK